MLLALVIALGAVALMTACGEEEEPPASSNSSTPPSSNSSVPDSGNSGNGGNDEAKKSSYTVKITDKNTGKPIPDVSVFLQDEESYSAVMYARGTTDENGIAVLKAEPKYAKFVYIEGLPKGYVYNDFYALGATGVDITVETKIVENEGDFSGIDLTLGDVMYDFTLNTFSYDKESGEFTSKQIKLSDLFASGKKAVMLNFWYTTCTYCVEEFPYIQASYERYGDDIEIIAVDAYGDTEKEMKDFITGFAKDAINSETGEVIKDSGCALTFPMAVDTLGLQEAFGFTVNPCSVIIDRYGVISMVQVGGVLGERYFTNAFDHFIDKDYKQELYSSIYDLSPMVKPDIEMSPEEEMKEAVVNGDINISFHPELDEEDKEYAWPFIVYEKDGEKCIASTNYDLDNSFAILYVDVELKKGQAIMFDYFASTQNMYDVLHVIVDNAPIYTISGRPLQDDEGNYLEEPWQACCPWVATEDGTYEVAFCYIKDESEKEGDDRVYLDNFRVVDEKDINIETYIPRFAATDLQDDNTYANYVDVVYNENDGYYHVGTVDGPILLAGLQGVNTQFYNKLPEEQRTTVTVKLADDGEFFVNGKNVHSVFFDQYCNFATNSRLYGYCSVTKELKGYLEEYVKQNGFGTTENTWLELCSYYTAYGTEEELADPIKGLTTFCAFDALETQEGELGFKNKVTYTQIMIPRGYLYKFVPTKSGVYRITSKSSQEVDGWIFTGNYDQWNSENGGDRVLYLDSTLGERYCPELLIDPDGDGKMERDFKNCSMVGYLEAGKEYYIDIAFYDVYAAGSFTFDIKYVADSFDVFIEASPGVFTRNEGSDIIAGGINVALCEDENDPRYGYYCHLLPNGKLGSIVYADFHFTTNIFPSLSLKELIDDDAFNMTMTEIDHDAYVYYMNYYDKDGEEALRDLWGDEFEERWEMYQMDDIIEGKYHGKGPDYTKAIREYLEKLDDGTDGVNSQVIYPERQGCVPVDKELAVMLQALMDKFSFPNVENSWTKLCYYYKSLDVIPSVEEKVAELDAMVNGADVKSEEIKAEIELIVKNTKDALENSTIETVQRNMLDNAMTQIYALIQADKAQSN